MKTIQSPKPQAQPAAAAAQSCQVQARYGCAAASLRGQTGHQLGGRGRGRVWFRKGQCRIVKVLVLKGGGRVGCRRCWFEVLVLRSTGVRHFGGYLLV